MGKSGSENRAYHDRVEVNRKSDFNTMCGMMEIQLYPSVMPRRNLIPSGQIKAGASLTACMRLWPVGRRLEQELAKGAIITLEMSA